MLKIKKMLRAEKGFTLIELLIVVAIIAILATMALSGFAGTRDDAQEDVNKGSIAVVQSAVDRYYFKEGVWPTAENTFLDVVAGYLPDNANEYMAIDKAELEDGGYIRNWPQDGKGDLKFVIDNKGVVSIGEPTEE